MFNPMSLFYTDGYKLGHKAMLAPNIQFLYGTGIPRSTKFLPKGITKIVSIGQQLMIKFIHDSFQECFFSKPISEIDDFIEDIKQYLGMDFDGNHFYELHKLGYLPIKIKSLDEGVETGPNIPHYTIINTVAGFAWLTLYLETIISALHWQTAVSATLAKAYKRKTIEYLLKTDKESLWLADYLCHDFSARGLDPFTMISSGLGHASSFRGSDSLVVIPAARYYYGESFDNVCINSVNASEHSVSCSKIFTVGEQQMITDYLNTFPNGILSLVSDTFDLWKLITEYLPANKELIMTRNGKLVIRPDSGDPVDIICGESSNSKYTDLSKDFNSDEGMERNPVDCKQFFADYLLEKVTEDTAHGECGPDTWESDYIINGKIYTAKVHNLTWNRYDKQYYFLDMYEEPKITIVEKLVEPKFKGVIELLWDIFGGTINSQGYKVLDSHIGAIYGDSITLDRQQQIYDRLEQKGFASSNIVLGIGSYTYRYNTRDTIGMAIKGAWFETDEKAYNIYKEPITDNGTKKSKKGLLKVELDSNNQYICLEEQTKEQESEGLLHTIYNNGELHNQTSLTEIREKLNKI